MEFLFKKWNEKPLNRHKNNRCKENIKESENLININEINTPNIIEKTTENTENLYKNPIVNKLQITNHVENVSYDLLNLVNKIENLPCKKPNKNTIISKGDFHSTIMVIGESPNEDDNLTFTPISGDKKQLIDKMFNGINIDISKIYTTYMFFWDTEDKLINKKEIDEVLPILHAHILIQKPKLIITLGSTVAKALLKLDGIMKYRGTFQQLTIEENIYPVFIAYSPSYIIKMNKYKEYEEDFICIKDFLIKNNISI
jgi:uracil-DNA glycosylase family 4